MKRENGGTGAVKPALSPRTVYWLWSALTAGVVALFALQGFYPSMIGPASNVLPAVCAAVALVSALSSVRRYGAGVVKSFQATWVMFAAGTCLWAVAEVVWAVYYFALRVAVPYPSAADFFYMGGYVPMLLGVVSYLRTFRQGMTRRRLVAAVVAVAAAAVCVVAFVIPPELGMSEPFVQRLADISYPVLDLSLLSVTVISLAIFYGASLSRWLLTFAAATISYVIADELFLYMVSAGTYYNGSMDDLIFLIGYLLFALAFYEHRKRF